MHRIRTSIAAMVALTAATIAQSPLSTTFLNNNAANAAGGTGVYFDLTEVITVITRMPVAMDRRGGWGEHTVGLPEGRWRDLLTGRDVEGGTGALADLLDRLPVALLTRR